MINSLLGELKINQNQREAAKVNEVKERYQAEDKFCSDYQRSNIKATSRMQIHVSLLVIKA